MNLVVIGGTTERQHRFWPSFFPHAQRELRIAILSLELPRRVVLVLLDEVSNFVFPLSFSLSTSQEERVVYFF